VPGLGRFLGCSETAPSGSVGPAALQGRALEGACGGDWVFDKDGKTRTSRWKSISFFTWGSSTWRNARSCCPGAYFFTYVTRLRLWCTTHTRTHRTMFLVALQALFFFSFFSLPLSPALTIRLLSLDFFPWFLLASRASKKRLK
jgi:hypothetical protein